ncbi:hypothetical protein BDV19DRAFT_336960 [Aspergillus venezuelensis]
MAEYQNAATVTRWIICVWRPVPDSWLLFGLFFVATKYIYTYTPSPFTVYARGIRSCRWMFGLCMARAISFTFAGCMDTQHNELSDAPTCNLVFLVQCHGQSKECHAKLKVALRYWK